MAEPTNVLSPPRPNDSRRGWDMPVSSRPDTDRTQIFVTDPNGTEEELVRSQKVIAELSELVTNSTELAEAQEQQLYDAQTTNDELTADISSMRSQSVRMETRIDTLTKQLERDARMQEESIEEWRTRCAALERRLTTAQTEKDNANFVADELRADIYSGQRAAEASVALAKSQAGEERSKARSEMDALVNKLLACERALEEKGTELTRSLVEVRSLSETVEQSRNVETNLSRKVEALHQDKEESVHHNIRRESELEKHIEVLLDRTDVLKAQDSRTRTAMDELRSQNEHLTDVNRVLAVRLKAASAESEAHKMEVEARQLLQRQNDEMERQIKELRRTITTVIPQRY